jgi:hypothetical protein
MTIMIAKRNKSASASPVSSATRPPETQEETTVIHGQTGGRFDRNGAEVQVRRSLRCRFWVEAGAASVVCLLGLISAVLPNWIELMLGRAPDRYDGSAEWLVAVGLLAASGALFAVAALEWRRVVRGSHADAALRPIRESSASLQR